MPSDGPVGTDLHVLWHQCADLQLFALADSDKRPATIKTPPPLQLCQGPLFLQFFELGVTSPVSLEVPRACVAGVASEEWDEI